MKKYLVIIKTARKWHAVNNQLCGIFDTEEEAIEWVLNNPTITATDIYGDKFQFTINLKKYDHKLRKWIEMSQSELREFIREYYIVEFNGSPVCVAYYED